MLSEVQDLRGPALADMRPTRATVIGLLIGSSLAIVAAMGPLVSAITITVGVETQVGDASGLPDARMLPAALEGVGAVALIFLLTRRPAGHLRARSAVECGAARQLRPAHIGPGDAAPAGEDG